MAVNASLRAVLDITTVGNFVIVQCFGVTRASVQVTRIGTGSNVTTTMDVQYSNEGAMFIPYTSAKTITLSTPTGTYQTSPIQVGCTEPYDINAMWLKITVTATNASGSDQAYVDVLAVDQVTPGGSYIETIQMGNKVVPTLAGQTLMPSGFNTDAGSVVT